MGELREDLSDGGMIDPAIIRGRDSIPVPAFDKHFKDTLDHDPGSFEGRLAMTDVRVYDDVLSEFFSFARFHDEHLPYV